jgi:putative peptidoglycan lipid II flippase
LKFISNTIFFSLATLISRILGYIRDATIAFIFGANVLTDAFFVAWRLPNTLRQLIGEGSFNAAFIPIFTEESKKSEKNAVEYASSLFSYYTLVLSVITFFVVIFAPFFVKIIAPGFVAKGNFQETVNLVRIVFPYLVLVGWFSFFMALLNTKNRFFIPAVSPALLNLSFIFFALFLSNYYGIYALAYGALTGGVLQVLLQIPFILKERFLIKPTLKIHPAVKETLKRLLPAFASFGVSQFSFVIDTLIASFLVGGAISYLYYGNRIFQLPLGLFAVGLGNALLVSLSKYYAEKDLKNFNKDFNVGIQLALFISIPATVGTIVLGKEIIDILFVRGAFSKEDAEITYYALIGYSIGLAGYALTRPFKSGFFAIGDMKTPLNSTIFGIVISIVFAILLGFALHWGVFGLALASSIGGFANAGYLYFKYEFEIQKKEILKTFLKVCISSIIMGLFILVFKVVIHNEFLVVFLSIPSAIVLYFIVGILLKEYVITIFLQMIKRKIKFR